MKHSFKDHHIKKTVSSFLNLLYATLGVFVFLFVIFHIASSLYTYQLGAHALNDFRKGQTADFEHLKEGGDKMAAEDDVISKLANKDFSGLLSTIQQDKKNYSLGNIAVADAQGILISRTNQPNSLGSNVFLSSPVGRVVATGKSVQATVQGSMDPKQLAFSTARPIVKDGQMIGALFSSYLLDDDYAARFRDLYLSKGVQVAFYTKDSGIYGDSFDPDTDKLVQSYFNSGSDWIKNGETDQTVSFGNGTYYYVTKTDLAGIDGSPGGVLLFIPRYDLSFWADTFIPLATLLVFIFFAFRIHWRNRQIEQGWRYYVILVLFSLPVLGVTYLALRVHNAEYLQLEKIPYTLYNSTLRLQPEWGIYSKDFDQRFSLVADTGDEAINAIQATLKFDPEEVDIKEIDTSNSACSYFLDQNIDSKTGQIDISCVILNSKGEKGTVQVADIIASPKQIGTFSLAFDEPNTHVLASDGLATDVLRATQGGSYRVDNFDPALLGDNNTKSDGARSFVVFSPTHANQDRWYNSKTASFVWVGKPNEVYVYAFDTSPNTIPSHDHTIQGTSVNVPITGTGVFYFHLQLASGGPIAHYKIQSDQTPPTITSMDLSSSNIKAGDVVRLSFSAEDPAAGIGRNYYVDLGDHLFLPIGSQLFVPFLEAGDKDITLRVYDKAGNYTEKITTVHVLGN